MKKLHLIFAIFFSIWSYNAQLLDPVQWKTSLEKKSDTEYVVHMNATIDNGWHLFSQFTPDGGSLPTVFSFKNAKGNYDLVGKVKESPYKKVYSEVFEVDEYLFENKAQFQQTIRVTNPKATSVKVYVEYQVCKEACIQQDKTFAIALPTTSAVATIPTEKENITAKDTNEIIAVPLITEENKPDTLKNKISENQEKSEEDKGLLMIFLLALLGGIGATFTPCVYPMIPMTVSFFLKQSGQKAKGRFNAIFYGICIVLICFLITIPFHLFEGLNPDMFSEISTNVYVNIFFFIIFSVFAMSFLGAFEITLPSSLSNKVDNASNKGGLLGIFFMALTLIIVSFSCIGPALGLVFGTSLQSDGGAVILSIAMLGFGFGLALPFMFFALTPSLLGEIPKSGGWLNTVKVVFGFVELALAFKFLSNADIGLELHWLEREVFIAIWIAVFGSLSLYLFGKIRLPHDGILNEISVGRLVTAIIALTFTIYLIPGLWGAPLKLISAFPPPKTYSESPQGFGGSSNLEDKTHDNLPKGAELSVHNLISFTDYETGVNYAKEQNKPILIDFTGKQCVNCRLMENNVWSDPEVLKILKEKVVLISLYGDDKKELPKSEQFITKDGKEINTIGKKWSNFQIERFNNNSRPLYVLLDHTEKELIKPIAYTPDIKTYKNWLEQGIAKFK